MIRKSGSVLGRTAQSLVAPETPPLAEVTADLKATSSLPVQIAVVPRVLAGQEEQLLAVRGELPELHHPETSYVYSLHIALSDHRYQQLYQGQHSECGRRGIQAASPSINSRDRSLATLQF